MTCRRGWCTKRRQRLATHTATSKSPRVRPVTFIHAAAVLGAEDVNRATLIAFITLLATLLSPYATKKGRISGRLPLWDIHHY